MMRINLFKHKWKKIDRNYKFGKEVTRRKIRKIGEKDEIENRILEKKKLV
jgi:hypothetical protein